MDLSWECVGGRRGRTRAAQKLEFVLHIKGYKETELVKMLLQNPGGAARPLGILHSVHWVPSHPSVCVEGGWEQQEPAEGMPLREERWQQLSPLFLCCLHGGKKQL